MKPPSVLSPFAQPWRYLSWGDDVHLLGGRCPSFLALANSCANPISLFSPSVYSLLREVFAGCHQTLLRVGSSRCYLCESFSGCQVPYSDGSAECSCLFLPLRLRPSPRNNRVGFPQDSAKRLHSGQHFGAADISLCSGLKICSPPWVVPTAAISAGQLGLLLPS